MVKFVTRALMLCGCLSVAMAQEFPLWEPLLNHYGGKTDETSVPSMKMGNHMQMSLKGKPQPGDEQRARKIEVAAREVGALADVNLALRAGACLLYVSSKSEHNRTIGPPMGVWPVPASCSLVDCSELREACMRL